MKKYLQISLLLIIVNLNSHSQSGWTQQYFGMNQGINSIFFIDENTGWAGYYGTTGFSSFGHIERTSNGGTNWTSVFGSNAEIKDIRFVNSQTGWMIANEFVDIGITVRYIYKSTNSGVNYTLQYLDSLNPYFIKISVVDDNNVLCLKSNGTLVKTSNGGIGWSIINIGFVCIDMQFIGQTGWILGASNRIYKSTNSGNNWTQVAQYNGGYPNSFHFININTGFVADDNLYKSTNGGSNWSMISSVGIPTKEVSFTNDLTGWVSGSNGIIRYTSNGGMNWFTQSMPNNYASMTFNCIQFLNNSTGWCSGYGTLVYPNLLGVIIKTTNGGLTSSDPISSEIPKEFLLSQNHPNPFNPATKIKLAIPAGSEVTQTFLSVYDILGRKVAILVNEQLRPGTYEVDWDASAYPSGVYFYSLVSSDFKETRRMVLLK